MLSLQFFFSSYLLLEPDSFLIFYYASLGKFSARNPDLTQKNSKKQRMFFGRDFLGSIVMNALSQVELPRKEIQWKWTYMRLILECFGHLKLLEGIGRSRIGQREKLDSSAFSVEASTNHGELWSWSDSSESFWHGLRNRVFITTTAVVHWYGPPRKGDDLEHGGALQQRQSLYGAFS